MFEDGDGLSLTDRLAIDTKVAAIVPIPQDYWYEKYQLPKPEAGELADLEDDDDPKPDEAGKKEEPGKAKGEKGKKP